MRHTEIIQDTHEAEITQAVNAAEIIQYANAAEIITLTLCSGRHATPAPEAIYPEGVDPANLSAIRKMCREALEPYRVNGMRELHVYVTGLSAALAEVIRYTYRHQITLVLYHYNLATGEYMRQDDF